MTKWHAHVVHVATRMNMVGGPGPPLNPVLSHYLDAEMSSTLFPAFSSREVTLGQMWKNRHPFNHLLIQTAFITAVKCL